MACMLPAAEMTAAEKACCRQMAGNCGQGMQGSHPCCKTVVSKENPALLVSSQQEQQSTLAFVAVPQSEQIILPQLHEFQHPEQSHSPPLVPLSSIRILRI
jgi:hypothetical protein